VNPNNPKNQGLENPVAAQGLLRRGQWRQGYNEAFRKSGMAGGTKQSAFLLFSNCRAHVLHHFPNSCRLMQLGYSEDAVGKTALFSHCGNAPDRSSLKRFAYSMTMLTQAVSRECCFCCCVMIR
jgi:hypothetical protein